MGILADALRTQVPPEDDTPLAQPGNFSQGLRSGVASMGAQLQALAGSAAQTAGFDQFAAARRAAAQADLAEAAQAEQQVANPTWDTVHDLRGGANWLGYKAGQLAPALAGGAAAGAVGALAAPALGVGAGVGAIAAPTLAFTPLEAGDIALRNPQTSLATQLGGGLASSAMMNVLPGALGGRMVGAGLKEGAKEAAKRTLGQSVLAHGAENVLGQAAAMGGGEATKEYAAGQDMDPEAIKEAALGGAVMGVPMAGAHVVGDVMTGTPVKGANAIRDAALKAKEMASKASKQAAEAVSGAKDTLTSPEGRDDLMGRMRDAFTPKGDEDISKVAGGQPLDGEKEVAGQAGQQANDQTAFEKVKAALHEMAADVGISSETRKSVEDTLTNLANHPSAVRMGAAMVKGWQTAKDKAADLKGFVEQGVADFNARQKDPGGTDPRITDKDSNTIDGEFTEVKNSDDFSGMRKVLTDTVVPWLRKNSPDTLNDSRAMDGLGHLFKGVLDSTYSGKAMSPRTRLGLFQHFGNDTTHILDQMHEAMGVTDRAELTNHFKAMAQIADDQKHYTSLKDLVSKALAENNSTLDPSTVTSHLMEFATRDPGNSKRTGSDEFLNAKTTNEARQVQALLDQHLGKRAKSIMKAVEAEAKRQQEGHGEAANLRKQDTESSVTGDGTGDAQMDQIVKGGGRRYKDAMTPDVAEKVRPRFEKEHPGHVVSFKTEKEMGRGEGRDTHGFLVAEKLADKDKFSASDYKSMAFDTKGHGHEKEGENLSRIDVEGHSLDATKIEKAGRQHLSRTGGALDGDGTSRRNQALLHGLAQLKIEHPEANVHDGLVVRHERQADGTTRPVTLGEIKSADAAGTKSKARTHDEETLMGMDTHEIEGLNRGNHQKLVAAEAKLQEHAQELVKQEIADYGPMTAKEQKAAIKGYLKDKDLREKFGVNELEDNAAAYGKELYKRERSATSQENILEASSKYDVNDDANIHHIEALKGQGDNDEHHIAYNMDGSPRDPSKLSKPYGGGGVKGREQEGKETVVNRGREMAAALQAKNGLQSRTGNTLGNAMMDLSKHMDTMTTPERARLIAASDPKMETAAVAKMLAPLKDKYLGADWKAPEPANTAKGTVPKQSSMDGTPTNRPNTPAGERAGNGSGVYADRNRTGFDNTPTDRPGVDALYEKVFGGGGETKPSAKPSRGMSVEERLRKDKFDDLDTTAKVDKFLKDAYSLWENGADDRETQSYLNSMFDESTTHSTDLAAFYDGLPGSVGLHHDDVLASLKAGESPGPKAQAAEKAAFLAKVASGDKGVLSKLATSTDPKALQRAVGAILENRIGERSEFATNLYVDKLHELGAILRDQIFNKGISTRKQLQAVPEYAKIVRDLFTERLRGDSDAGKALAAIRHAEAQAFSLERSTTTNAGVNKMLNGVRVRTLADFAKLVASGKDVPLAVKEIMKALDKTAGEIKIYGGDQGDLDGAYGHFKPGQFVITVDKNMKAPLQTLVHEAVHAATTKAITTNPELNQAFVNLLDHIGRENPKLANAYAMKNSHEFVAEALANREFQTALRDIKPSDAVRGYLGRTMANAWDSFVGLVRRALNLDPKHESALSQVLDLAGRAMKETEGFADKSSTNAEFHEAATRKVVSADDYGKVIDQLAKHFPADMRGDVQMLAHEVEANQGATAVQMWDASSALSVLNHFKEMGVGEVHTPENLRELLTMLTEADPVYGADGGAHIPSEALKAVDTTNDRIRTLLHDNPDAAYGMQLKKPSLEGTTSEGKTSRSVTEAVKDYLDRATPWVKQELDKFMRHAGEFDPTGIHNVIRVAVNALNPMSTAYHESMHAFVHDLMANGHHDIVDVLQKAADSPVVLAQMKQFFKDEIGVLRQIRDNPEERVAVMYQMWAQGKLNLAPKAEGVFARIRDFFRKVTGHWTNEEHAEHIMDYFRKGDYAEDRMDPSLVGKALMSKNFTQVGQRLRTMARPIVNMAEEVMGAGGQVLRDTQVPSLMKVAELVKKQYTAEGADAGFIPAAREAYLERANKLAGLVEGVDESVQREALHALQTGTEPTTAEAKALHAGIRSILAETREYLTKAGVTIGDLGEDYFPRTWDPHYLSKNKEAFMDMARKYPEWHDPESTYNKLVANDGVEFQVVDQPGMDATKLRKLAFISHEDAAPFMTKELLPIVSSYLQQASRKGEWARRFGADSSRLKILFDRARTEGATVRQVAQAEKFMRAVNGTLGDDLNPTARRLMGDMIVYQNVRLLPLAFFSQVVDPMGLVVRGASMGNAWSAFKRGIREIPTGLKGGSVKDEATKLAEDLDVISKASLVHALGASYTQGVVGSAARKVNDTFFRYNLMEQWNTSMRVAATEASLQFMAKHDAGANAHSARYMKELGLQAGDIKMVDGRVATKVSEGLTEAQAARVKSAVNQWVDSSVLRPDAADKAMWMSDPHFMLLSHLKQFVYAFHHTILGRVAHEAKNGNYTPAMALMGYVPIMIAADAAKGVIQSGGSGVPEWKKDWGVGDYVANGVERAGLLGVGQFGMDAMGGNIGSLSGPTLDQLGEAVKTLAGREQFRAFALHSMPANGLYSHAFGSAEADPKFPD